MHEGRKEGRQGLVLLKLSDKKSKQNLFIEEARQDRTRGEGKETR